MTNAPKLSTRKKTIRQALVFLLMLVCGITTQAQTQSGSVGVGTTNPKAALHVASENSGLMIPKYATLAIANANSLPGLNSTDHKGLMIYVDEATNRGFWFYNGTAFEKVGGSSGSPINFRAHGIQGRNYTTQEILSGARGFKTIDYENSSATPLAASNWNPATGVYTVPVEGLYHIDYQIALSGVYAAYISAQILVNVNDLDVVSAFQAINTSTISGYGHGLRTGLSISTDYYFKAGDKIYVKIRSLESAVSNGYITTFDNNPADYLNIRLMR